MQTVHVTKYTLRTLKGNYVKVDEGIGYIMFDTRKAAKDWAEGHGEALFPVKVRIAVTPIDSGRAERLVALHKTRPKTLSQADYQKRVEHNFFP